MHWQSRREQFREQLTKSECIYPASVFDPLSARMADDLGFELAMFAGSIASMTVLGNPDLILLTLSEFSSQSYRINRACQLPLLVDADHGYGNALNVRRTVEELETAGVSALSIEDTQLPAQFGESRKNSLISIDEGVGKMRAAVDARTDENLVIAARTSAPRITDTVDTIARVSAYQQTGVDAIFLVGVKDRAQLEAITSETKLPIILGGAGQSLMNRQYLGDLGVRVCLQGHQPFMAAMQSTYQTLAQLRAGAEPSSLEGLPEKSLVSNLTREQAFDQWRQLYMGKE